MRRTVFIASGLIVSVLTLAVVAQQATVETRPPNAPTQKPAVAGQTRVPEQRSNVVFDVVTVAEGLVNPWAIEFLPDGRLLVTERPGRLRIVTPAGQLSPAVTGLPTMDTRGQGGLLDVALDPAYAANQLIYWSYAEPGEPGFNNTAVARGKLIADAEPRVENVQVIFHQTPSLRSSMHFGSRLVFGRDGLLFVTMGERSILEGRVQAQRLDGLLGKIARINPDGSVPKDNPFVAGRTRNADLVIRPSQHSGRGVASDHGELWEVEHGARGGDEINIARKGRDYGWPTITYGIEYSGQPIGAGLTSQAGMEQPVYYWDPVIAPGGMEFYTGQLFPAWRGNLFIGGMGSTHLARLVLDGDKVVGEERCWST
jgi:glucose/arabinose dehydrogenase